MGTRYLIDSNAAIDFLGSLLPIPATVKIESWVLSSRCTISIINRIELYSIVLPAAALTAVNNFISSVQILPLSDGRCRPNYSNSSAISPQTARCGYRCNLFNPKSFSCFQKSLRFWQNYRLNHHRSIYHRLRFSSGIRVKKHLYQIRFANAPFHTP